MKQSHYGIDRGSWLSVHTRVWAIGLAVACVALAPSAAWGQSAVWQPQGATTGTIYYNGGNIGIGTTSPSAKLEIGNVSGAPIFFGTASAGTWAQGTLARSSNTDQAAFRLVPAGAASPANPSWYYAIPASSANLGIQSWDGTALSTRMTIDIAGNVGIGTTNPQHTLHVAGTIGAQEVIVSSTGADYVFSPGYRLRPLSEVAAYIQQTHHLPDIPPAKDAQTKGVSVGEMQTKLLAKIEELTLHMIQADERNNHLEKQNEELRNRIVRLETGAAR